jgi:hypothetical protein
VLTQINTAAASQMATVNFSVSGTITLTSPLPPLNYPTTINGGNTITISGNDAHRPFFVGAGTAPFTAAAPAAVTARQKARQFSFTAEPTRSVD